MSLGNLARRVTTRAAEVRAFQDLFEDPEWRSKNQSGLIPLLAYTLGRVYELEHFRSFLTLKTARNPGFVVSSALELLEKYDAEAKLIEYLDRQIKHFPEYFGRAPEDVFDDVCDIYDLFYISRALGDRFDEKLSRVVSIISLYLESLNGEERRKFERSILNLKSSNLCFGVARKEGLQTASELLSPMLAQSAESVARSHEEIINRISEHYDTFDITRRFTSEVSQVLRRLIELSQQDGERVIRTVRSFGDLLFEGYGSISFIPSHDETSVYASTVIATSTPRYRIRGSTEAVISSLSEFISRSRAENLAVFIVSSQSGFKKILESSDFSEVKSLLQPGRKGVLIPLIVRRYTVDFAQID